MKRKTLTCASCASVFEPKVIRGEIQCPRCGVLQETTEGEAQLGTHWTLDSGDSENSGYSADAEDMVASRDEVRPIFSNKKAPAGLASLDEQTELGGVPPLGQVDSLDDLVEEAERETTQDGFHDRQTQIGAPADEPEPGAATSVPAPRPYSLAWLGPVLLSTALFLAWVTYDKLYRPSIATPTPVSLLSDDELVQGVRALRNGNLTRAQQHIEDANKFNPTSPLAQELLLYMRTRASKDASPSKADQEME